VVNALLVAALLLTEGTSKIHKPLPPSVPAAHTYVFAQTQRVEVGGGRTRVTTETNVPTPRHGYFPLRVFIDNTTGPRQTLKIGYFPSNSQGRPISKSIEVLEGERRTVILPVPYLFRYGALKVRGPGITEKGDAHVYFNSTYAPQRPVLVIGTTVEFEGWVGHPPAHTGGDLHVHALPAEDAPTELAAYTGYDTVVIPALGFESLNEAQRRALEAYAATGGTLVLKQARGLAAALPLLKGDPAPESDTGYGLGRLVISGEDPPDLPSYFRANETLVGPRATPGTYDREGYRYDNNRMDRGSFAALLPQATAPIGRFLFIIGLFTLAIGPGSIWVARRRGPAALLLTIPSTAFVTCAAIIGYSVIQDGFTVHGSTHGLTVLDSKQHRAINIGLTAYYANLAPGSARFSNLVTVVPPIEGTGEVYAPSIEWGESAEMGSDFVPSRTYREWGFVSAEPTRARVVIKKKDGTWVVQNALGSTLASMVFMADDAVWTVTDIRDGSEGAASKGKPEFPELDQRVRDRFGAHLRDEFDRPLKEGEFLAKLVGQGFTPSGGLRINHHESLNLVRGEVER
jgi:hypothetical protein